MTGCCVPFCSNHSRNGWRLYRFPREPNRRLQWTANVNRDKWQPSYASSVCEIHFLEESFEQHRADGWRKLKPNAVPTLFPRNKPARGRKSPKLAAGAATTPGANDGSVPTEAPEGFASVEVEVHMLPSSNGNDPPTRRSRAKARPARTRRTTRRRTVTQKRDVPNAVPSKSLCSKSSCVESRKKLADMTRRHDELVEAYAVANSTVNALRSRVDKLESTVEILRQHLRHRESEDLQPSP
uniref:THAP-type domain-containing protein n=1 Tax=Rhipicephalus microplus TaxID=6941 RepID=A0A6M2CYT7_RHIMP